MILIVLKFFWQINDLYTKFVQDQYRQDHRMIIIKTLNNIFILITDFNLKYF